MKLSQVDETIPFFFFGGLKKSRGKKYLKKEQTIMLHAKSSRMITASLCQPTNTQRPCFTKLTQKTNTTKGERGGTVCGYLPIKNADSSLVCPLTNPLSGFSEANTYQKHYQLSNNSSRWVEYCSHAPINFKMHPNLKY